MTEFRNLSELDLEWDAIIEILSENGNRVHTTLYKSLKTNNVCFHRNCGTKYIKQKLEQFTKNRDNVEQPSPSVRCLSVKKKGLCSCILCNMQLDRLTRKSPHSWFLSCHKAKCEC